LTDTLDRAGFKVRHSMDVCVSTSCRLDGRASGGAADTMRHRHTVPDAPCDDEMEPAPQATRQFVRKGILRKRWLNGPGERAWPTALPVSNEIARLFDGKRARPFQDAWDALCNHSKALKTGTPLRPSDLPRQIAIAKMILRQLRMPVRQRKIFPGDKLHHEGRSEPALTA
jgi:hypothetical protein